MHQKIPQFSHIVAHTCKLDVKLTVILEHLTVLLEYFCISIEGNVFVDLFKRIVNAHVLNPLDISLRSSKTQWRC